MPDVPTPSLPVRKSATGVCGTCGHSLTGYHVGAWCSICQLSYGTKGGPCSKGDPYAPRPEAKA